VLALPSSPQVVRFCFQTLCKKVPMMASKAYPDSVDCSLPHPVMILMGIFGALRFCFLAPGHQ
jgi:hypothetical protein